jgi:hypothetical protein
MRAPGQAVWLKNHISRLRVVNSISKPFNTQQYSTRVAPSGAAKHVEIKYYVVKDESKIKQLTYKVDSSGSAH